MAPGEKKATKRQSIHPSAVPADVDGAVALVGASRTVGVVRDDGCAHLVEALELVGGEFDGCGAQVVGELVGVAHPQDHRGDCGLRLKPGKRHLPLIDPLGLRNLLDRVEDPPCPFLLVARFPRLHSALRVLAQARGSRRVRVALVLAGEPAAGLGEDPKRGMEAWEPRNKQERTWRILDTVEEIAKAKGVNQGQVSLAWLEAQPAVTSVILGVRN